MHRFFLLFFLFYSFGGSVYIDLSSVYILNIFFLEWVGWSNCNLY